MTPRWHLNYDTILQLNFFFLSVNDKENRLKLKSLVCGHLWSLPEPFEAQKEQIRQL